MAVTRLAARLDRLEDLALDRSVCRAARDAGLDGWELADLRGFAARVGRFRRCGLSEREALVRVMVEEGLSADEARAVLDDVEAKVGGMQR